MASERRGLSPRLSPRHSSGASVVLGSPEQVAKLGEPSAEAIAQRTIRVDLPARSTMKRDDDHRPHSHWLVSRYPMSCVRRSTVRNARLIAIDL